MKRILVIDGAAGTGKSDLLEFVQRQIVGHRAGILKKFTTRKPRPEEERTRKALDLKFVTEQEFDAIEKVGEFYSYRYPRRGRECYGFYKSDLELLFAQVDNVFLIVRSAPTIQKLIEDFPDVEVIPLFVYTIETLIEKRLRKDGYTTEEIKYRMERTTEAMDDLYTHPTLYRRVIVNNSDRTTYQRQLKDHFDSLLQASPSVVQINARVHYDLPSVLQPYKKQMVERLRKYDFARNIFVMMDFKDKSTATFDLIKLVVESNGFHAVRADMREWSITNDDVYNPFAVLYCCRYGIALFDTLDKGGGYNVNVAIELALMHFQDKHCLMLKHESLPTPPFDLASKIFKTYSRTEELVAIIKQWLSGLQT